MEALVPLLAILMVFGSPIAIIWLLMHYRERKRMQVELPAAASASSAQLMAVADRMEHRIDALEQILDAEAPGWRKKYHEHS